MIKAILIDDIEQARITLKKDLLVYASDVEVIAEAGGVVEGAKLLRTLKPDVVFLDIQMQDGSGFDLLEILPEIPFKIIFITASDAHAIKAFRYAAIDYLLKPVDPDELVAAIDKLRKEKLNENEKYKLLNDSLKSSNKLQTKLALHAIDRIQIIEIKDIVRCESSGNYTIITFVDKSQMVVSKTLKEFNDLLVEHGFYRVHKAHLVNTKHIREYVKTGFGCVIMADGVEIPVSVRKKAEFLEMLGKM